MLNAYIVRRTSRGLRSEKATILKKVISIKFSLKHYFSIFAIAHFQKYKYGRYPAGTHKSLNMANILLALTKFQIWLISY